jgi:hypothetical protein
MKESLLRLRELVLTASFLPVAVVFVLLATAGAGLWKGRWRRVAWALSVAAVLGAFLVGVLPLGERGQEWREVLLNGQLL